MRRIDKKTIFSKRAHFTVVYYVYPFYKQFKRPFFISQLSYQRWHKAYGKRDYFCVDANRRNMSRNLTAFFQGEHYRINKFLLNLNGQWPYAVKRKKIFFAFAAITMFVTGFPGQLKMIIVHRTDWMQVLPSLGPLFVHVACAIKLSNSLYHEKKMRQLMERIYDDWHAPMGSEKKVLKHFADDGRLFTMIYTGVLYVSMTTYLIVSALPRFLLVNGWANITTSTVFPIPVYFTPNDEEYYIFIQSYLCIGIIIVLSISVAVDSMFVVYIQHGCGIFAAVGHRLEHLIDGEDLEVDLHPPRTNDTLFWIVVDCIKKHNEALQYADLLEGAFHWSFFLLVWINMLSLSFTGLQVVWGASTDAIDEAFRQAIFGSSQLLHLLFINLFSQRLTDHSLDVYTSMEDGSLNEWAIIELQGDLKHSTGDIKNAQFIGDLHFTESGVPILIIGIHVLYGKETALSKPFAVLEKIKLTAENGEKTDMETEDCESTTEYIVKAIVKKKLTFKGRPKPIVTDVPICT